MPANLRRSADRHTDLGLLLELHSASVVTAVCKSEKWRGNVVSGMAIKEHDNSNGFTPVSQCVLLWQRNGVYSDCTITFFS